MKKILTAAAVAAALALGANSAHAKPPKPPGWVNGVSLNGMSVNGVWQNGFTNNGLTQNGIWENGTTIAGQALGSAVLIGIELTR